MRATLVVRYNNLRNMSKNVRMKMRDTLFKNLDEKEGTYTALLASLLR